MITLKNPDTGERIKMDAEALEELLPEVEYSEDNKLSGMWFRGMRLDTKMARKILDNKV